MFNLRGKISNKENEKFVKTSKATATRDLTELTEKFKILARTGELGAGMS